MLQVQRHAVLQAQHDAWMASPARSPAAEEEEDAGIVSSEDREMPQAEAEIAEEVFSLFMAAEGFCSENDSGADQTLVRGMDAASWRMLPIQRPKPGSTRPAAVAVVEKTAVTASGPGGGLMDGSAAQESLRQEVRVVAAVAAVAVVDKTAVTASGGALKPLQDGSAGSTRQLYLSAGVLCGWRTMVAPSGGGLKEAVVVPQKKRLLEWVVGGICGSRDVSLKVLGAGSGGGLMEGSTAQRSMRQEGGFAGAREMASRALVAVPAGSAALQSTRQQQGRLGVATPGVREAASRVLAALFRGSSREGPASAALKKRKLEKVMGRTFGAWKDALGMSWVAAIRPLWRP
ncbi:unnamed protein product [Closterium sp. NIES-65]|nr:unnamed protein product [Closterium sp. NIES-65]